jgi:hypothetical protein
MRIFRSIIVAGVLLAAVLMRADARRQTATDPRVSLELKDQGVAEAVKALFQAANRQYRLSVSPIPGRVTVSLRDVPLTTALRVILRQSGVPLTFRSDGEIIIIEAMPPRVATPAQPVTPTPAPPGGTQGRPAQARRRRLSPPWPDTEEWYSTVAQSAKTVADAPYLIAETSEVLRCGVRLSWLAQLAPLPWLHDDRSYIEGITANDAGLALAVASKELSLYPKGFLNQLHLIVIIGGRVSMRGEPYTGTGHGNALLLDGDGTSVGGPQAMAKTLHHELMHVVDFLSCGELRRRWGYLSPLGKQYKGRSKRERFGLRSDIPGFVTAYAATNEQEDRAETFAYLVMDLQGVEQLAAKDHYVAEKVACVRRFLPEICPEFDSSFWDERRRMSRPFGAPPGAPSSPGGRAAQPDGR